MTESVPLRSGHAQLEEIEKTEDVCRRILDEMRQLRAEREKRAPGLGER